MFVDPMGFDNVPEGQCRPGFFRGVATVVVKLFNIIEPTHAFFGQKDAVQCVLIKRLIEDLNFPISLQVLPTCREPNGLAMSTRNQYLTSDERHASACIYAGLQKALAAYKKAVASNSIIPASELRDIIENVYRKESMLTDIQYISISSKETLQELKFVEEPHGAIVSIAVKMGNCRLIDNIVLE
jgi:pantoate--beta-alanine ligase